MRTARIRYSLWTLPVAGLLGTAALLLRGPVPPLPDLDPAAWAEAVTGSRYPFTQYAYIVAYVVPYPGFWALYAALAAHRYRGRPLQVSLNERPAFP